MGNEGFWGDWGWFARLPPVHAVRAQPANRVPAPAPRSRAAHRGMTPARGTSDRLRDYCPTRPGRSTFVNSTAPSCSRSRTVISALSPSMSTSPKNW